MLFIPNVPIPILPLPDRLTADRESGAPGIANLLIGNNGQTRHPPPIIANLPRREFFPRGHNPGRRPAGQRLKQRMDVIGHNHPLQQAIALGIEKEQRVLGHAGDRRFAQHTGAVPRVPVILDAFPAFHRLLLRRKPQQLRLQPLQGRFG
jgi:hypothetical protein